MVDESGSEVAAGVEGELCIAGPSVLQGYWNLPENTVKAFLPGRDTSLVSDRRYRCRTSGWQLQVSGTPRPYDQEAGYRIELGEIEVALYRHPAINEAAVLAFPDDDGVPIKAFTSMRDGSKLSIIELKKFCSENLPLYMVPDSFRCLDSLPKTSTDKIDYQKLKALK